MIVDSHPPPLAKNGSMRALSIRALLLVAGSAATDGTGTVERKAPQAKTKTTFLVNISMEDAGHFHVFPSVRESYFAARTRRSIARDALSFRAVRKHRYLFVRPASARTN